MRAKREFRDRPDTQVRILDALVERRDEGATVLELRSQVDTDIDGIEEALSTLKDDGLIEVDAGGERTLIHPADRVVPDEEPTDRDPSLYEKVRRRLPF
jgi:DNA-binding transcriptional ArsR family regulator